MPLVPPNSSITNAVLAARLLSEAATNLVVSYEEDVLAGPASRAIGTLSALRCALKMYY